MPAVQAFTPSPPCQPGIQTPARHEGADVPEVEPNSLKLCFTAPLARKAQTSPYLLLPCCRLVLAQLAKRRIAAIDHKLYDSIPWPACCSGLTALES